MTSDRPHTRAEREAERAKNREAVQAKIAAKRAELYARLPRLTTRELELEAGSIGIGRWLPKQTEPCELEKYKLAILAEIERRNANT